MEVLTIDEFNNRYGVTAYGVPRYKMVCKDDINTYVSMLPNHQRIPYFCEWLQENTYHKISEKVTKHHRGIKYIIDNLGDDVVKSNESLNYDGLFSGSRHHYSRKNVNVWRINGGMIVQTNDKGYPQFDYLLLKPNGSYLCVTQRVGFSLDVLRKLINEQI